MYTIVNLAAAAAAKSLQLCPTLCHPIDVSPPGFPFPGILQARILEWVAIPSPVHESEKWKWRLLVMSNSYQPQGLQPTRLLHPWDCPGKSTGVGCHCLLWVNLAWLVKWLKSWTVDKSMMVRVEILTQLLTYANHFNPSMLLYL